MAYYNAMHGVLGTLYQNEIITLAEGGENPDWGFDYNVFADAAVWLHDRGKFTASMLKEEPAQKVWAETVRVLGNAFGGSITHEVPDALLAALNNNAFIFSGFKTYHSLQELGLKLTDEKGEIKPFNTFLGDVQQVNAKYNQNYLYAEYNHAVHTSQMAVKWHDFEEDEDRYNLQYRTAGDEKVRQEHAALDGTTLPPSDPFWEQYLPPNGWNCRCNVVQVLKNKYPVSDSAQAISSGDYATAEPKQQIFRFNAGKTLELFPPKHPYYKAPPEAKAEIGIKRISKKEYAELEAHSRFGELIKLVKEYYRDKAPELDYYERAAMRYYSGDGYTYLNKHNRGEGKTDDWDRYKAFNNACSKVLDNAIFKKAAKYEGVCYRGTKLTQTQIAKYRTAWLNDKPITEKHFLSTSYAQDSAFNGNVFYQITSKTGVKIEDLSRFSNEKEVLFRRGTKFRVTAMEVEAGNYVIKMEEI